MFDPLVEELESKAMSAWVSIGFAPKDRAVDLWVDDGDGGYRVPDAKWERPVGLNEMAWCVIEADFGWNYVVYPDNKHERITHYSLPLPGPNT